MATSGRISRRGGQAILRAFTPDSPPTDRGALDLRTGSGFLADFLVAVAILSAAQIAAAKLGVATYSYRRLRRFCLPRARSSGLAYTFRENEHIRMTLLLYHARGGTRRALELVSLSVARSRVTRGYACDMTIIRTG